MFAAQQHKFFMLSNEGNHGEVFDHLVKVRSAVTGEVGLLLCSHHCEWPEELIPQATWLAGCFSNPEKHSAYEDRLMFGYHPNDQIKWEILEDEKAIILKAGRAGQLLLEVPKQLAVGSYVPKRVSSRIRAIHRMVFRDRASVFSGAYQIAQVVEAMTASGRFKAGEEHYVGAALGLTEEDTHQGEVINYIWQSNYTILNGTLVLMNPDYNSYMEIPLAYSEYEQEWEVVNDNAPGFQVAMALPYDKYGDVLEVTTSIDGYFHVARYLPFKYRSASNTTIVNRSLPEYGWAPAVDLDSRYDG
jgi:hypothetical protein